MGERTILVGDAGGTNVRFALARAAGEGVALSDIWKRRGGDFSSFDLAIDAYLSEVKPELDGASFGFAGAVSRGRVELLHRDWVVDRGQLQARLGLARVVVVNDFFAMARAAPELSPDGVREIAPGKPDPEGSLAVGGPGTGFGVAMLRRSEQGWIVVGGEGGHQIFAPQTDLEWKLAERLRRTVDYVSNEFIAAGAGFEETRDALFDILGAPPRRLSQAEVIAQAKAGDTACLALCRLRAATVMTTMGDMALVANATGGVFIAGGVSFHLAPWLKEKTAIDRFRQRGPRAGLLAPIPINLIASESAPLIGAAKLWLDVESRGWL
jgi:glucokinase